MIYSLLKCGKLSGRNKHNVPKYILFYAWIDSEISM